MSEITAINQVTFYQSDSFPREDHKQFYVYDSMPHVSSSGGDDLAPPDEVKVYNDEGEQEEQRTSEDISEEKIGLVTETEQVCARCRCSLLQTRLMYGCQWYSPPLMSIFFGGG